MSLEDELLEVARRGELDVVTDLLDRGVNVEARNKRKETGLIIAAGRGRIQVVSLLLTRGADTENKDNYGNTPLIEAARFGKKDAVDCLLAHGANIEAQTNDKWTALMLAARDGYTEIVDLLMAHRANANPQNVFGQTALILAALLGKTDTVKSLVSHANINAKDIDGKTALDYAMEKNFPDVVEVLSASTKQASPTAPQPLTKPKPKPKPKHKLVSVLPPEWSTTVDEKTEQTSYFNKKTKEQHQILPSAYPLVADHSFPGVTFYDKAKEEFVGSSGKQIDFENGLTITVPTGVVAPGTSESFKAQASFAPEDVYVLPEGIKSASPAYLISKTGQDLNGEVTMTIAHHVKVATAEDAKQLTILCAESSSETRGSKKIYKFQELTSDNKAHFVTGERHGKLSTSMKHFSLGKLIKVGWKKFKKALPGSKSERGPNLYTVRVYKSPLQTIGERVAIFCLCLHHPVYKKFLEQLDTELIPRDYPQVSSSPIDRIIKEPLCFLDSTARLEFISVDGWSVELDHYAFSKRGADLPETQHYQPEELHNYPPKIVCRFFPTANTPKRTSCTFSLTGLDEEVKVNIPLLSPRRQVDTTKLQDATMNLKITSSRMKGSDLAPMVDTIVSTVTTVNSILNTSSSLEELAQHTDSIHKKVLELINKAEEVATACTVQFISAEIQTKLPEVKSISHTFNQVAKVRMRHCKDIIEEEESLADMVVTGTNLLAAIEAILQYTESLSSIAGHASATQPKPSIKASLDTPLTTNDLKDVYEALFNVRTKWYDIGLELDVDPETLKSVSRKQREDDDDCLKEMLLFRLKFTFAFPCVLTWKLIIESLRTKIVARNDVANEVEQRLSE